MAKIKRLSIIFIGIFLTLVLSASVCPPGSPEAGESLSPDWLLNCSHCVSTPTPPISVPTPFGTPEPSIVFMGARQCTEQEITDGCFETQYPIGAYKCYCWDEQVESTPIGGGNPPPLPTSVPSSTFTNYASSISMTCGNGCSGYDAGTTLINYKQALYKFNRPGDGKLNVSTFYSSSYTTSTLNNPISVYAVVNISGTVTQYSACNQTLTYTVAAERSDTFNNTSWGSYDDLVTTGTISPCCSCGHSFNKDIVLSGTLTPSSGRSVRIVVNNFIGSITNANFYVTLKTLEINGQVFNDVQPTPQPTATLTDLDAYCSVYDYANTDPVATAPNITIQNGSCFTVLPAFSLDIPAVGNMSAFTISWESFKLCPVWIDITAMQLFDITIPMELLIVPFLMFLITMVMRL